MSEKDCCKDCCPECGGVFIEKFDDILHQSDCVIALIKQHEERNKGMKWETYKLKKAYTQDDAIQYDGTEEMAFKLAQNRLWNLSFEKHPPNDFNVCRGWMVFVTNPQQPYSMKLFAGDWIVKDCHGQYSTVTNQEFRKRYMQDGD